MDNQLSRIFSPTYKDTVEIDRRFNDDFRTIFEQAGSNVLINLRHFQEQKHELEKQYAGYALKLCTAFLDRINYINETEPWDSDSNKYKWRSKVLSKSLRSGLTDLGFKPSSVSKLIGAAEVLISHKNHVFDGNYDFAGSPQEDADLRTYHDWAKIQSISALYEISRMDSVLSSPPPLQYLSDLSNEFKESVPIRSLEKLRQQYPKFDNKSNESFPKQNSRFTVLAEPKSLTEETLPQTQEQILDQLIELVQSIDLDMILVDKELRAKLESISHPLVILADLAEPTPTRPTYV